MTHSKSVGNDVIEKALINLLIFHPKETKIYIPEIQEDYFFNPTYSKIFNTIKELVNEGSAVDPLVIKNKTKANLSDILSDCPMLSNIKHYIDTLKDYADRRWFVQNYFQATQDQGLARETMSKLSSDIISRIRATDREKPDVKSIAFEYEKYQLENQEHLKSGNKYIGLESGFKTIDNAINGIRKGHYWIINAYNNTGKSYFLLNVANRLLNNGKRVLYFSLEMSRVQTFARMLGIETGIDPTALERGEFLEQELNAKAKLYEQDLSIYTQKRLINDIVVTIYAEQSVKPIDCVMIDYIQKIQGDPKFSRYERYTTTSDTIQKLSQELQIPFLVASQIDNQSAKSKSTEIVATKGSGDIANDVDFAVLLQKNEEENLVDCIIQKNRHGMKDGCKIKFSEGGSMYEYNY